MKAIGTAWEGAGDSKKRRELRMRLITLWIQGMTFKKKVPGNPDLKPNL